MLRPLQLVLLLALVAACASQIEFYNEPDADDISEDFGVSPEVTPVYRRGWARVSGVVSPWCSFGDDSADNNRLVFDNGYSLNSGRRIETQDHNFNRGGYWRFRFKFAQVTDTCAESPDPATKGRLELQRDRRTGSTSCPNTITSSWRAERLYKREHYTDWAWQSFRQPIATFCHDMRWRIYQTGLNDLISDEGKHHMAIDDIEYVSPFDMVTTSMPATETVMETDDFSAGASVSLWEKPPASTGDCLGASGDYACLDDVDLASRNATTVSFSLDEGLIFAFDIRNYASDAERGEDLYLETFDGSEWHVLFVYEGYDAAQEYLYDDWTPQEWWFAHSPGESIAFRFRRQFQGDMGDDGVWILDNVSVRRGVPQVGSANTALAFSRPWHVLGADAQYGVAQASLTDQQPVWDTLTDSVTIEAWVRLTGPSTALFRKKSRSWTHTVDFALDFHSTPGANCHSTVPGTGWYPMFRMRDGTLSEERCVVAPASLADQQWHHIAFTFNIVNGTEFYLDGAPVVTAPIYTAMDPVTLIDGNTIADASPDGYLLLGTDGRTPNSEWAWFNGEVDELRVWSRVRTPEEIAAYYDRTLPAPAQRQGLVVYQQFDSVDMNLLADSANDESEMFLYGYADWVLSQAPLTPAIEAYPDEFVSIKLTARHTELPESEFTFVLQQRPVNGTLTYLDDTPVTGTLPLTLTSSSLIWVPPSDQGPGYVDQLVYSASISSGAFGTTPTQNSTVQLRIVEKPPVYTPPPPTPPPPLADVVIDETTALIIGGISAVSAIFGAAVGLVGYRRHVVAVRNDRFRKLHESPKFTLASAFVKDYSIGATARKHFKDKNQYYWNLEEALTLRNHLFVHAIFETMPTETSDDIARAVIYLAEGAGEAFDVFKEFIAKEVTAASYLPHEEAINTMFRGYSVTSKMWSGYAKMGFGLNYLHRTLSPVLYEICNRHSGKMEIDRSKMDKGGDTVTNKYELLADAQKVFNAIAASWADTPPHLKTVLHRVFIEVEAVMGDHKFMAVGQFLFLRLFCPAIAVPEAYGLLDEDPAEEARRLLILISKMLQNLSTDIEFGIKEEYMVTMNDFITGNRDKYREFIVNVTSITDDDYDIPPYRLPNDVKLVARGIVHGFVHENKDKIRNNIGYKGSREATQKLQTEIAKIVRKIGKPVDLLIDSSDDE